MAVRLYRRGISNIFTLKPARVFIGSLDAVKTRFCRFAISVSFYMSPYFQATAKRHANNERTQNAALERDYNALAFCYRIFSGLEKLRELDLRHIRTAWAVCCTHGRRKTL